jgi:hypothetical protein
MDDVGVIRPETDEVGVIRPETDDVGVMRPENDTILRMKSWCWIFNGHEWRFGLEYLIGMK